MNPHQIIDLIVKTYSPLGARSLEKDGRSCVYNGPNGKHCAFAMMCSNPEGLEEGVVASSLLHSLGFGILKPEFRGFPVDFYTQCQRLHDFGTYWDPILGGLTDGGRREVEVMKRDFPADLPRTESV